MWALSDEYKWVPDDDLRSSNYVAPGCIHSMERAKSRGGAPSRRTDWFYLPNGVFFRFSVAFPDRKYSSVVKSRELLEFTLRAMETIDSMCTTSVEKPKTLDLLLYLWDGKKTLPDRPGSTIGTDNINTGVTSWRYDGSCKILVYRREDLEKTIVHELLHAYGVGDWCNTDRIVMQHCRNKATAFGVPSTSRLLPTEAVVDALALYITSTLLGVPFHETVDLTYTVLARILKHFHGKRWREKSNVFCYVALKLLLLHYIEALSSRPLDEPNQSAIRSVFAKPVPHTDPGSVRSKSLRMFPVKKGN